MADRLILFWCIGAAVHITIELEIKLIHHGIENTCMNRRILDEIESSAGEQIFRRVFFLGGSMKPFSFQFDSRGYLFSSVFPFRFQCIPFWCHFQFCFRFHTFLFSILIMVCIYSSMRFILLIQKCLSLQLQYKYGSNGNDFVSFSFDSVFIHLFHLFFHGIGCSAVKCVWIVDRSSPYDQTAVHYLSYKYIYHWMNFIASTRLDMSFLLLEHVIFIWFDFFFCLF